MDFSCLEFASRTFNAEDLLNTLPLFGKPIISIRAANNVAVFQASMSFLPGLSLLPTSAIRSAIFKKVCDIFSQRWLIVFSKEHIVPLKSFDLGTQLALRMQSIQAQNPPFHRFNGE